jgi:acetyl-CoA decarbonylase/synthase complex subunit beta
MPQEIKERVQEFIPPEIISMIATESDVSDLDELKSWLIEKKHPTIERWREEPDSAPAEIEEITVPTLEVPASAFPNQGFPSGMGLTIILKNAKIKAEKMIIKANKGS